VRHRAYDPELGRWTRRDPIGYVDGMGLYQYVRGNPIVHGDASGSCAESLGGCKSDFGISMSIGQSSSLDTLTSGGVVVTPVPFTWCVNLIGYAVCRAACSAADADERATATGIRNLCLAAANLVYSGCMGTCLSPAGTPLPTPYCASWEFVCDTLKGIQTNICNAVFLGVVIAADLNYQACGAGCRERNAKPVPGGTCPPGWFPFPNRDWKPIDTLLPIAGF